MKSKVLTVVLGLFLTLSLQAQSPSSKQVFAFYAMKQNAEVMNAFNQKEYKTAIKLLDDFVKAYQKLDKPDQTEFADVLSMCYYNYACAYSLLKKKGKALDYFQKAIDAGYKDYNHATKDTDLDYIRKEKKFEELMKRIRNSGGVAI
jgi:hypothetical protein